MQETWVQSLAWKDPLEKERLLQYSCLENSVIVDFPIAQMVKNLPAMQEMGVLSLGQEDPLEKEMAIHSSILDWRTPWTEAWQATVRGVTKSRIRLSD